MRTRQSPLETSDPVELRRGLVLFHHIIMVGDKHGENHAADICGLRVTDTLEIPPDDPPDNANYLSALELLSGADWPPRLVSIPGLTGKWIIHATPACVEGEMPS